MGRAAIDWLGSLCALVLRLSQAKTLSELVEAACRTERANLSQIGLHLAGAATAKARIKRVWRFTCNDRVEPTAVMKEAVRRLIGKRKKPLLVSFDWTEIGGFHTLAAAAVVGGRAVPLLWGSHATAELHKSRNALEEGLLLTLRDMIPRRVPVIILADRGFGRTELARFCQAHGFHYAIRINPDVWVRSAKFHGKLLDYPVKRGLCRMLRGVAFRRHDPVTQHVVVRWKKRLPKDRDEPWFLMTDLDDRPLRLTELYARRTSIEELFRDQKSRRNGWALRCCRLSRPERVDRLLLILALAYILLTGAGALCRHAYRPGQWCNSNNVRQCSLFTVGRRMWTKVAFSPQAAFAAVADLLAAAGAKWG